MGLCVLIRLTHCELPQLSHGKMPTSQSHYTGWLMGIRDSLGSNVWIHSNQAHDSRRHTHRETINNILRRAVKKHLQVAKTLHISTPHVVSVGESDCLTLRWLWTKALRAAPSVESSCRSFHCQSERGWEGFPGLEVIQASRHSAGIHEGAYDSTQHGAGKMVTQRTW